MTFKRLNWDQTQIFLSLYIYNKNKIIWFDEFLQELKTKDNLFQISNK